MFASQKGQAALQRPRTADGRSFATFSQAFRLEHFQDGARPAPPISMLGHMMRLTISFFLEKISQPRRRDSHTTLKFGVRGRCCPRRRKLLARGRRLRCRFSAGCEISSSYCLTKCASCDEVAARSLILLTSAPQRVQRPRPPRSLPRSHGRNYASHVGGREAHHP